jgi:hypothetical protein
MSLQALSDPLRLTTAAAKMMATLTDHLAWGMDMPIVERTLSELYAALEQVCRAVDRELGPAIDAKMAINRAREWDLDGTGHGYHRQVA